MSTAGLQFVVEDLDKALQAVEKLDKDTRQTVERLIGEIRRWRGLGKDLVHGAAMAEAPKKYAKQIEELKAALEVALKKQDARAMCPECSSCSNCETV